MIYTVNIDFTRKSWWVKDVHRALDPESSSYVGVFRGKVFESYSPTLPCTVCQLLRQMFANAYFQAPTLEKNFIICGPDIGIENIVKKAIITRALYGGKCAGRDFWNHLRSCMKFLGFESSRANPGVWMRESVQEYGITKYHEYVILYTGPN